MFKNFEEFMNLISLSFLVFISLKIFIGSLFSQDGRKEFLTLELLKNYKDNEEE